MILFPNAKINLGLFITQKRPDGFHNIETIFYPVKGLCDILEIIISPDTDASFEFSGSGIPIDCNTEDNICTRAYNAISKDIELPKVKVHLHKQIPLGAGLGGGSADGAFTLQALNSLVDKPLSSTKIEEIALELGSDCPFFLRNIPCFATGRGEVLNPIDLNLNGYYLMIVNPGIHVNTGKAYSLSKPVLPTNNLTKCIDLPVEDWSSFMVNDFEKVVFSEYPIIEQVKAELYKLGASFASMSGSGSTVFGIFREKPKRSGLLNDMFVHISTL